jgi:hypothetical protein
VILAVPRASAVLKVRGALGATLLSETLYGPVLDALYSHRPMTLSDIENSVRGRGILLASPQLTATGRQYSFTQAGKSRR